MKKIIAITALIVTTFLMSSCGNKSEKTGETGHEEHGEHESSSTVSLTAEQIKSIQLQMGSIEKKQLTASLKANGILNVPNQNKATITALMGGVIKSILVQSGSNVQKGQVIATIANTTFITMQEEYLSTSSELLLSEQEYKRQQELHAGNAGALKTLQAVESELKSLKARKASLQKQLELIGINASALTSDNLQTLVNVISPISGAISNVRVNIGTYVDANNAIAEVIDNSQLHLDLFIYERDLPKLKVNQKILFTLTNNPGQEYNARIYAISNTFEQNTKAVVVHATVEGEKSNLIDGMSITALVSLENATVDAVPTEAIVNYQGQDFIFVVTDEHSEEEHHEGESETHDEHGHNHSEEEHHHEDDGEAHDEHGHDHSETTSKTSEEGSLTFKRILVRKGTTDVGYSEITVLEDIPHDAKVVTKGAFFISAKMTNSGEGHVH